VTHNNAGGSIHSRRRFLFSRARPPIHATFFDRPIAISISFRRSPAGPVAAMQIKLIDIRIQRA
jgi:hypothetical protein